MEIQNGHVAELGNVLSSKEDVKGFLFKSCIAAKWTGGIGSIFAKKDPVMDFISLPLHPFKEPFKTDKLSFPVKQNIFLMGEKFFKRFLDWNSMTPTGLP
jgi:hypothetical protein